SPSEPRNRAESYGALSHFGEAMERRDQRRARGALLAKHKRSACQSGHRRSNPAARQCLFDANPTQTRLDFGCKPASPSAKLRGRIAADPAQKTAASLRSSTKWTLANSIASKKPGSYSVASPEPRSTTCSTAANSRAL